MEQKVLNGKHRSTTGKAAAKQCRREGRIPGVMYDGKGKSVLIDVDSREFMKLFKAVTESTIVKVQLDKNDEYQVFIKDFQHDICKDEIKHVDFYEVEAGKELRAKVSVKLEGSPEGVRNGGVLETGVLDIEVECLPKDLPPRIVVDVANLNTNESIHVRDLTLAKGVKVLTDGDLVLATVKFAGSDSVASTSEDVAAETATV